MQQYDDSPQAMDFFESLMMLGGSGGGGGGTAAPAAAAAAAGDFHKNITSSSSSSLSMLHAGVGLGVGVGDGMKQRGSSDHQHHQMQTATPVVGLGAAFDSQLQFVQNNSAQGGMPLPTWMDPMMLAEDNDNDDNAFADDETLLLDIPFSAAEAATAVKAVQKPPAPARIHSTIQRKQQQYQHQQHQQQLSASSRTEQSSSASGRTTPLLSLQFPIHNHYTDFEAVRAASRQLQARGYHVAPSVVTSVNESASLFGDGCASSIADFVAPAARDLDFAVDLNMLDLSSSSTPALSEVSAPSSAAFWNSRHLLIQQQQQQQHHHQQQSSINLMDMEMPPIAQPRPRVNLSSSSSSTLSQAFGFTPTTQLSSRWDDASFAIDRSTGAASPSIASDVHINLNVSNCDHAGLGAYTDFTSLLTGPAPAVVAPPMGRSESRASVSSATSAASRNRTSVNFIPLQQQQQQQQQQQLQQQQRGGLQQRRASNVSILSGVGRIPSSAASAVASPISTSPVFAVPASPASAMANQYKLHVSAQFAPPSKYDPWVRLPEAPAPQPLFSAQSRTRMESSASPPTASSMPPPAPQPLSQSSSAASPPAISRDVLDLAMQAFASSPQTTISNPASPSDSLNNFMASPPPLNCLPPSPPQDTLITNNRKRRQASATTTHDSRAACLDAADANPSKRARAALPARSYASVVANRGTGASFVCSPMHVVSDATPSPASTTTLPSSSSSLGADDVHVIMMRPPAPVSAMSSRIAMGGAAAAKELTRPAATAVVESSREDAQKNAKRVKKSKLNTAETKAVASAPAPAALTGFGAEPSPKKRRLANNNSTAATIECTFPGCTKSFPTQHSLKSHLRCHSEATLRCPHENCTATFRRNHDLVRHRRSMHDLGLPHECADCGKRFARADALRRHRVTLSAFRCSKLPLPAATAAVATASAAVEGGVGGGEMMEEEDDYEEGIF